MNTSACRIVHAYRQYTISFGVEDDLVYFVRTIKLPNNVSFLPGRREYCTGNSCVGKIPNRDGGRNEKILNVKLQETSH